MKIVTRLFFGSEYNRIPFELVLFASVEKLKEIFFKNYYYRIATKEDLKI